MSVTRGGTPGENAHMESFFHSLKADVIPVEFKPSIGKIPWPARHL